MTVDTIATEGERGVLNNQEAKQRKADTMFESMVRHMRDEIGASPSAGLAIEEEEVPTWLSQSRK